MATDTPRLYYFDMRGRAEIVRMVMAAGGLKFEDCRFTGEEWPNYKAKAPFGQCPYMEIDGQTHGQSLALAMYAARKCGLYGSSLEEQLKIDQVTLLIQDLLNIASSFYNEKDQEKLAMMAKKFKEGDAPRFFGYFETMVKNSGTGFLVGDSLSLADIAVFELVTSGEQNQRVKHLMPSLDDYPGLKALMARVRAQDKIKAYLASTPTESVE